MREMITNTEQYQLAIVTALPKEFIAVEVMLDQHHDVVIPDDPGRYTVGSIGSHPVIVTLLPKMGNNPAAAVSTNLLRSFPYIRDILMVGIAGGVPDPNNAENHVRLGDIVISMDAGVIQFDFGKLERGIDGKATSYEHLIIRATDPPPSARLQQAVRFLEARSMRRERPWEQYTTYATVLENAVRPSDTQDVLHDSLDVSKVIPHPKDTARVSGQPKLHYGLIGSSNMLLKEPLLRDHLRDKYKIRAIEMEGSGVATATWISDKAGYLLIRGICDYCDSHKNDIWQGYAAVVAAAYTKALIESIPIDTVMSIPLQRSNMQHDKLDSKNIQASPKDFLISYADPDLAHAEWIAAQLEEAGYSTHLRQWDVKPGSNAIIELDTATKEAQRTILLISPHYLATFDEHPEWTVAFRQDLTGRARKVLPVYIGKWQGQLDGLLGPIVPINLIGTDEATARQRLLDGVRIGGRRPTTPPPFPL